MTPYSQLTLREVRELDAKQEDATNLVWLLIKEVMDTAITNWQSQHDGETGQDAVDAIADADNEIPREITRLDNNPDVQVKRRIEAVVQCILAGGN